MKKLTFLLVLHLFSTLSFARQTRDSLKAAFGRIISSCVKPDEPGVAVLVAKDNKIICEHASGMADLEHSVPLTTAHVFKIGSITKQFTAMAILQLMEQGKLSLQDDIRRFLPDYPSQGKKITIEHLLTHTSGITSYTSLKDYSKKMRQDVTPLEMIDYFKSQPLRFEPGSAWEYNNSGYFLLGHIIEKITGQTYPEYIEEHLFGPSGMTASLYGSNTRIIKNRAGGYSRDESGFRNAQPLSMTQPYAAGSVMSTVGDLFKWHMTLNGYGIVKKETLEKAYTRYRLLDGSETSYGYGWMFAYIQGLPTIEHGGTINGAQTMAIYIPQKNVYVAVFSNCECIKARDIAARLAACAIGNSYEFMEMQSENSNFQDYAGVYENEKGAQRFITLDGRQLFSQRDKDPKFRVKPYQRDMFFVDQSFLTLEFSRNNQGAVEVLTTKNRQAVEIWRKTDKPIPAETLVVVDEKTLESYVGRYEMNPSFGFKVTREKGHLFVQATGQERFEVTAETESKFYFKTNGAGFEFMRDESGKVTKVILTQGGRKAEAKRI